MPAWFADHAADKGGKGGILDLYKKAIGIRKGMVAEEGIEFVDSPAGTVRFRRGGYEVIINVEAEEDVSVPEGEVLVSSGEVTGGNVPVDTTVWVRV
jgi:alpha-glucosidase